MRPCTPHSTLFPYTTLFRSRDDQILDRTEGQIPHGRDCRTEPEVVDGVQDVHMGAEQRFGGAAGAHVLVPVALVPQSPRSEEHTSELQSRPHLVCRLLLEKN